MAGKLNVPATRYGQQLTLPWNEFISFKSWVAGGQAQYGPGLMASYVIQVPWAQRTTFLKDAIGWSQRRGASIHRKLPWQNPHYPWLRCTRVNQITGVHWIGHSGDAVAGELSDYDNAHFHVTFESLPYAVLEDFEVGPFEWFRYVIDRSKPHGELASADGITWYYAEGTRNTQPVSGTGRRGIRLTKKRLNWVWVQVPQAYIMNAQGVETNLLAAINKVNSVDFAGYTAGTLLFDDYDLEPRMMVTDPDQAAQFGHMPRAFDVTLHFTYFDPGPLDAGATTRGWNTTLTPDFKWALINTASDGSGQKQYRTVDFATIFQGV